MTLKHHTLLFLSLFLCFIFSFSFAHYEDSNKDTNHHLRSKSLILVKIWCLILIFTGTFVSGVSPYFFKWNDGFLVLGTQFAGGVFLGTALMHFLSDANETFKELTEKEYPFAFMLACVGFLATMLADCVVSFVLSKQNANGSDLEVQGRVNQSKDCQSGGVAQSQLQGQGHNHFANHSAATVSSFGDSILLVVALCFHSVFEGIAIEYQTQKLILGKPYG